MNPSTDRQAGTIQLAEAAVQGLISGLAILAAVGVSIGLWSPDAAAFVLLGLIVMGVALALIRHSKRAEASQLLIGQFSVPRCLLIVAAALVVAEQSPRPNFLVLGLAVSLLIPALVLEPILARLMLVKAANAHNLPGVVTVPELPALDRPVVLANAAAVALGLIVGLIGLPPSVWLVVATISLVPAGMLLVYGRDRLLRSKQFEATIGDAVADYAPEFLVYTARPDDAAHQVTMWLPYLQRSGRKFIIVTRDELPARALAKLTDVPIVVRRRVGDLDDVVPPSLRAAFYVNASSGNGAFIRYSQLTHVYLGHGDSDKPPSYNPTHAMYDKIFAAGPAATRRYAAHGVNIPLDKFEIVGRPQVEGVAAATGPIGEITDQTVLYAPTWRGHVEETMLYSLPVGERIVAGLLARGARVIFRPHPFSFSFSDDAATIERIQQLLAADAARSGRAHLWGPAAETDRGIIECINTSDAMVSDVSSVVSDYLFSGKPFAMVAVPTDPTSFVSEYPIARAAYVLDSALTNLDPVLDDLLGPDPAQARRQEIRVDYLGDFPADNYASAFINAVREVSDTPIAALDENEEAEQGGDQKSGLAAIRKQISAVGRELAVTGAALLSLGTVILEGPLLLAAALGVLAVGLMLFSHRRDLRKASARPRLVGSYDLASAILILAIATAFWRHDGHSGWALAAAVLAVIAAAGEPVIADGWGRKGLEVSGLPGLKAHVAERVPRHFVPLALWSVIVLGWLLVVLDTPPLIWFVLALLQFVLFADALIRSSIRVKRVVRAEGQLRAAVAAYAPTFAIYFSSTVGAAYQIGMWLPYLERIGQPFIIVVRNVPMLRAVAEITDVPVIHRPTLRALEDVIVPGLTTAFYVNNAVRNTHFVERRELTHVWLNHGDSEKPACFNPVHAIYDLIFAAGQAGIDRYARHGVEIPLEKFLIVGRPQVEQIEPARAPIASIETPTVLYAPTWQGPYADTRVYSLPLGEDIVRALIARGVRVIFRAHPFNYRFPEAVQMIEAVHKLLITDRAESGREHLFGTTAEEEMTVEECFNASDAMICDVSAVVSDYLQSGKPFSIVSVGRTVAEIEREAPAARAAYVLQEDLSNIDLVLDDLLQHDPLIGQREQTRVYYLGDFPRDHYADGFVTAARSVISGTHHA